MKRTKNNPIPRWVYAWGKTTETEGTRNKQERTTSSTDSQPSFVRMDALKTTHLRRRFRPDDEQPKILGDVSHTVAQWSQVLTPRDRMFTGEVNISDYA